MRECGYCSRSIVHKNAQARYCSDKCRNYARLERLQDPIPKELRTRNRWVRRTERKVPLTVKGIPASSTDASSWSSYAEANASQVGVGLGFVVGDGVACIDLDHVVVNGDIDPRALRVVRQARPFYVEWSPSGDGLHAWVRASSPSGRSRYTQEDGLKVEWYSKDRYITITGKPVSL
jgi:primase-polymerase (primpol)-like protein